MPMLALTGHLCDESTHGDSVGSSVGGWVVGGSHIPHDSLHFLLMLSK